MTSAKSPQNSLAAPVNIPRQVQTLGLAIAIGLLNLGLAQQINLFEFEIVQQIANALAENKIRIDTARMAANVGTAASLVQLCILVAISWVVITISANRNFLKSTGAKLIASLQFYLLTSIIQVVVLSNLNVMPMLASSAITTMLSCATGIILLQRAQQNKVFESQYYELKLRNDELFKLNLALVERDEVERRILAADLHDQVLNDLKKILENFSQFEKDPENKATSTLIRSDFNKTMTHIREIMDDLSPIMLQNFGLRAALEDCLEKGRERSGYSIDFQCDVDDDVLDKLSMVPQTLLYRLVQESLTNVSKHANASKVSIEVRLKNGNLLIAIEDNGKGIDYNNISHQSRGLRYMKLRADLINAVVDWKPGKDGKGTRVVITRPMDAN